MPAPDVRLNNISHRIIYNLVPKGSRVLDLGCGNGELLSALTGAKSVAGQGVEISEDMVIECLKKGLSIIQGNIDEGLKEYPDNSYDYVILNETLQSVYNTQFVLDEMLRVGEKAIVGIPNFAHWKIRTTVSFQGTLPVTRVFNFEWYNTPNIRLITIKDFRKICGNMGIKITGEYYYSGRSELGFPFRILPNLFCENALFLIEREG